MPYFTSFQCVHIRAVVAHLADPFEETRSIEWDYFLLVDHSMVIPAGKTISTALCLTSFDGACTIFPH